MKNISYKKIVDHFEGNKTAAYITVGLLAAGGIIFIINCIILLASSGGTYRTLRTVLKAETDLLWIASAVLGTKYYPTKRNMLLIPTLIMYAFGDVAVMYSYTAGAVLYFIGHIFMLMAILETTYIRRWQIVTQIVCLFISLVLLFLLVNDTTLLIAGTFYAVIVTSVMAFSLSNRFFRLAGVVFAVSDITGLLRISLSNNKYTYLVTTAIYFAAFFMLCISVYSTSRKEVVTMKDLFRLLRYSKSMNVKFWLCGRWALGLIRGDIHYSYKRLDLAFDIDNTDEFLEWIRQAGYKAHHRYSSGVRHYYSEKYGALRIFPCIFESDKNAVLISENGHRHILDEGFFEEVRVLGRKFPCIAPGGQELIHDVIS